MEFERATEDTTVFKFQIIKENWFIKVFLGEISKIMLIEP